MSYREHAPPARLAPWLECVWERKGVAGPPVRVVPDGCIDVVWTEGLGTHVVGANSTVFLVDVPEGTRVVGARMRPGAAPPLLGVRGDAVRDARPLVREVWGDDGERLAAAMQDAADPVGVLLAALEARPAGPPDPPVREVGRRRDRGANV